MSTSTDRNRLAPERLGLVEYFRPGEYARAEQFMEDASALGLRHLRCILPWSDWQREGGAQWYEWLIPQLARTVELLPCLSFTAPQLDGKGEVPDLNEEPAAFEAYIDAVVGRFGDAFEWLEVGNSLDDRSVWNWSDPERRAYFSSLLEAGIERARQRGKNVVLAGLCLGHPESLEAVLEAGWLNRVQALGISGFPGTWDFGWQRWPLAVRQLTRQLKDNDIHIPLWTTASGYSTWRRDEVLQARKLVEALRACVARVYWYSFDDLPSKEDDPVEFGRKKLGADQRCYHFGLRRPDHSPKFALRIWQERGLEGLGDLVDTLYGRDPHPGEALVNAFHRPPVSTQQRIGLAVLAPAPSRKPILITGGAGFVGSNLAQRLVRDGRQVVILDNLQRPGVERNLEALLAANGDAIQVEIADVRDLPTVRKLVHGASQVYHFAAQVAVTTSLETPREDFEVNLTGTLNVLESLREMLNPPPLLFTSTNKVYGALDDVSLRRAGDSYEPDSAFFAHGISEQQALDFHSPYGCSKGAADQYVLDYARSYGLPAAVFRMSCIYGPHQFGTEDQGWVAHFLIQAMKGRPLTLYGDGRQVRDLLFVEDLIDAMLLAQKKMPALAGRAFNMGGGLKNSASLLQVIARIEALTGRSCDYSFADWRLGDQRYYVSDTRLFEELTGWHAATDIDTGLRHLYGWLEEKGINTPSTQRPLSTGEGALHGGTIN
ncbi:NAD-dependent epimerase/dehydratase family protein [Gilvimarinus sp. F26214L]|uniref:NAD-dependent epimerase/dehydratase family protein n=1 Tax=Gilvimarinus sp. DZF01 TaxID=3461371 RepID=UPI00404527A7